MAGHRQAHRSERAVVEEHGDMASTTLYAAHGSRLIRYTVDVDRCALLERDSVMLPAGLQYAWSHASRRLLYCVCSDGRPGRHGSTHWALALDIAGAGRPVVHGDLKPLAWRPVHISVDRPAEHALIVYPAPSGVSVLRIAPDGSLGDEVAQSSAIMLGKTAHQILVTPEGDQAVLLVRGNDALPGTPEDPGALEIFDYRRGRLTPVQTIAPNNGYGFGPRHVDFHPTKPWMYMSVERQNEIACFDMAQGRVLGPRFRRTTLAQPAELKPRQLAGAVHVHPNGRFVYVSNRADGTVDFQGVPVFNGGENSIAVYAIEPSTGEPRAIQFANTHGMHPRAFHIDPSGRMLVAANMVARKTREEGRTLDVPAGLSVFRIESDGRLTFVRKYDVDAGDDLLFWVAMMQ